MPHFPSLYVEKLPLLHRPGLLFYRVVFCPACGKQQRLSWPAGTSYVPNDALIAIACSVCPARFSLRCVRIPAIEHGCQEFPCALVLAIRPVPPQKAIEKR